jgi:uncharacterized membrane protein YoaT (DUF817 family)
MSSFRYTFLSKWTVLALTAVSGSMFYGSFQLTDSRWTLILGTILLYGVAWIVAFSDSIQERKFLWSLGLVVMIPIFIGPMLYSVFGPKNTR